MAVTNSFSPNTRIKSSEVNANFTYITDLIDKTGSPKIFVDSTNSRVGIGTVTPSVTLQVVSAGNAVNVTGAGSSTMQLDSSTTTGPGLILAGGTSFKLRSTNTGDSEGSNNFILTNVGSAFNLITITSTGATHTFNGAGTSLSIATTSTTGPRVTLGGGTSFAIRSTSTGDAEGTNRLIITNAGGPTNLMTILSTGLVGIGTVTPGDLLSLSGAAPRLSMATTTTSGPGITLGGGTSFQVISTSTGDAVGTNRLLFYNVGGATNLMVLDSSGNLGIGTTSPSVELHVNDAAAAVEGRFDSTIAGTTYGLYMGADASEPFIGSRTNHSLRLMINSTLTAALTTDNKLRMYTDGSTTNYAEISSGTGDDLQFTPFADGDLILFGRHQRSNNGSTTYQNAHVQSGWTYVVGTGAATASTAVTFPTAYSASTVRVLISTNGQKGSAPTSEADVTSASSRISACAFNILTTGFSASIRDVDGGIIATNEYIVVSWVAIGAK